MRLFIMRHGQAEPLGRSVFIDRDRALTADGRLEVANRAVAMAPLWKNCVIFSSTYRRAQQSAEEVLAQLGNVSFRATSLLEPDAEPDQVVGVLTELVATGLDLLLISHMPLVSRLCSYWVHGDIHTHYPLSTAGVHELDCSVLGLAGQAHWVRTCL